MGAIERLAQVVRLSQTLLQRDGFRAFLTWKPFSITSFRVLQTLKSSGYQFNTIIDGGANRGQFARAATESYPDAHIVAFEPLPDIANLLRRNLKDREQVRVVQSAIGSRNGTTVFYRQDYTLSSSVLRPIEEPDAAMVQQLEVPICRLDDALDVVALKPPILIKLDLQGYEIEALRGAPQLLAHAACVLLEASFESSYEEEPLFTTVLTFMREAGFDFLRPVDVLRNGRGVVVQMDALFTKSSARDTPH